jgi:hypothetical protein
MRVRGEIDDDIASLEALADQIDGVKKRIQDTKNAVLTELSEQDAQ